jgi:hypothetical protein
MKDCGLKCKSRKEIFASYSMKIVIITTFIIAIWQKYWIWAIVSVAGFFISLIPTFLHKDIKFTLPWSIEFLFASVFGLNMVGILLDAYNKIPYFDTLTQIMFSVLVAFFAFAIIYVLHIYWDGLIMDKYAMAFLVVVTTISSAVVLEFIKWFQIFGRKQTTIEGVLTSLLLSTIFGIITALIGVSLIKSGRFENITEELGKQIDSRIIRRKKN